MTRRDVLRSFASAGLLAMLGGLRPARASRLAPLPSELMQEQKLAVRRGIMHMHCSFCDGRSLDPAQHAAHPCRVLERAVAGGDHDFAILSPHAEQVSRLEAAELDVIVRELQSKGYAVDWGQEWTGIPDGESPSVLEDAAFVQGGGHALLYNAGGEVIGHHRQAGGQPTILARTYPDLLRILTSYPRIIAGFPHPELYGVETTWAGFAPPPPGPVVEQFCFCELNSHGARGYQGPGDVRDGLRGSNEAGFRTLIGNDWLVGAAGNPDEHLYTGQLVPEGRWPHTRILVPGGDLTIQAVYAALRQRRMCFSEDRDATLVLAGHTEAAGWEYLMGDRIPKESGLLTVHAQALGPVPTRSIAIVAVSDDRGHDVVMATDSFPDGVAHFGRDFLPDNLRSGRIKAIYAKARLTNDHLLVSSPLFRVA